MDSVIELISTILVSIVLTLLIIMSHEIYDMREEAKACEVETGHPCGMRAVPVEIVP